jgi:hypothetical protein
MRSARVAGRDRGAAERAYARDEVNGTDDTAGAKSSRARLRRRVIIEAHHARLRHVRSQPVAAAGPEDNDA